MSDIAYLIERLEELAHNSPHLPMTAKLLVDEDTLLRLVEQFQTSVPVQIREAQRVLQEHNALITQGEEKAASILKLAQEQADDMVSETSILTRADAERRAILERAEADAAHIRETAQQDAAATRAEADDYALSVLRDLERTLASYQRTIANGVAVLRQTRGQPPIPSPPPTPSHATRVASPRSGPGVSASPASPDDDQRAAKA